VFGIDEPTWDLVVVQGPERFESQGGWRGRWWYGAYVLHSMCGYSTKGKKAPQKSQNTAKCCKLHQRERHWAFAGGAWEPTAASEWLPRGPEALRGGPEHLSVNVTRARGFLLFPGASSVRMLVHRGAL
jgi:hypothetical protein